ncbi:hypothetical protein [Solidesulfovibrio sp. C21]|uniref:hypothetical protein n=1 Tax=Solidesulfovibrio sp. C21 TaxID=3398613 RepID=UPI0039FDB557
MRIICLSCGHKMEVDTAYDDFEGPIKCLCGAMLHIKTEEGKLKEIHLETHERETCATTEHTGQ